MNILQKEKLKKKYGNEEVYVIPRYLMYNIKEKFNRIKVNDIWTLYDSVGRFMPRYDAEYNEAFVQLIPYVFICNEDESKFYVSKRISGEERLLYKLSLGFGGHINPCDGNYEIVLHGLIRELNEELDADFLSKANFLGTIRNDNSKLYDHLGLAFIIKANEENISIKEKNTLEGFWMAKEDLFESFTAFENWSQYFISYLYDSKNEK